MIERTRWKTQGRRKKQESEAMEGVGMKECNGVYEGRKEEQEKAVEGVRMKECNGVCEGREESGQEARRGLVTELLVEQAREGCDGGLKWKKEKDCVTGKGNN